MTETYYTYAATQTGSASVPSGTYTLTGGFTVTVASQIGIRYASTTGLYLLELTGDVAYFIQGNVFKRGGIWLSPTGTGVVISETGLSGVTGAGLESLDTVGRYGITATDEQTITPQKEGAFFIPSSVTYDEGKGKGVYAVMEGFEERQVLLSSPADAVTGVLLYPLLQWSINGEAQEGDLLNIYLRAGDSNFTSADLIGSLIDATSNSSLQIVSGLGYNVTYYWQIQAAGSEEDDLVDSDIQSYTCLLFNPPFPTGVTLDYGEDPPVPTGTPTGVNNMATLKRIVAAANNKVFYET